MLRLVYLTTGQINANLFVNVPQTVDLSITTILQYILRLDANI